MAYTKIVQAGIQTEIYSYQKNYVRKNTHKYVKNRHRAARTYNALGEQKYRSNRSIQRARISFLRLVTTNLGRFGKPCFLTVTLAEARSTEIGYLYLRPFWAKLKKQIHGIRYIGVPEWQKRGVLHFHFLVWGIPVSVIKKERSTRNIQRLWHKGFCDIRNTRNCSIRLAWYLVKYLSKTLSSERLSSRRAYICSRNVAKATIHGSNNLDDYLDMILPVDSDIVNKGSYDTVWLGVCDYKIYKTNYNSCSN